MPNHHGENGACLEEVEVMLANGDSYGMQSCQTSWQYVWHLICDFPKWSYILAKGIRKDSLNR